MSDRIVLENDHLARTIGTEQDRLAPPGPAQRRAPGAVVLTGWGLGPAAPSFARSGVRVISEGVKKGNYCIAGPRHRQALLEVRLYPPAGL
jgi:hypothetical protein